MYIHDMVESEVVFAPGEVPRVARRGEVLSVQLCKNCADQVRNVLHQIKRQANQQRAEIA